MLKTTGWEVGRASGSWVIQRISQGPGRKQFTWDGSRGSFKERTVFGSRGRARWTNRVCGGTKKLATVGNSQPPGLKGWSWRKKPTNLYPWELEPWRRGLVEAGGWRGHCLQRRKEGTLWPLSSHLWLTVVSASPWSLTTKRAWMMWSAGPEWASKCG